MIPNLPTLPPAFLERCLAFSEQLYTMKSGVAKLEISPSHFLFSIDQHPGNKETGPTFLKPQQSKRKKTPSDLRRNARRMAEHLERKNIAKPSTTSSLEKPESTTLIPPTSEEKSIPTSNPEDNSPGEPPETAQEPPFSNDIPSENEVHMDVDKPVLENVSDDPVDMTTQSVLEDSISSPPLFSIKRDISEITDLNDAWPEDLNKILYDPKTSSSSFNVATFVSAKNYKSAIGSLRRTLKKCNLRSIEPKKVEDLAEGAFAFELKLIRKNIKASIMNIKNNWINDEEEPQLCGFLIKDFFLENNDPI